MSQQQRTTNTFQGGIEMDIDVHLQKKDTSRYMLNGRILFNINRNSDDVNSGTSFSFTTEDGNKLAFSVCEGFQCVGAADLDSECISMWTNGIYGQIRTFKINDQGQVTDNWILFDDRFDPNSERFRFSPDVILECKVEIENENARRVYFWDHRTLNEPKVINIELLYRKNSIDGKKYPIHWNWNLTNPDAPVLIGNTQPACGASVIYPHWLSIHSFNWNTDVIFPTIKFHSRLVDETSLIYGMGDPLDEAVDLRCSLKTGKYQYFVRYVTKDGYKTPISPMTQSIFLTSMPKSDQNHHDYTMYASNVVTPFGIKIQIKDIDTRYFRMEVGYVFYLDKENPSELTVFSSIDISSGTNSVFVNHVNHSGVPVSTDIVLERYETILGVNTGARKENKMYLGGIKSIDDIRFNVDSVTFTPYMRLMNGDKTIEPKFEEVTPTAAGNKVNPATNSDLTTKTYTISKFSGVTEDYEVVDDYDNYKGMQFESLFKGHWKGEIYGYGALLLDLKGNPLYVVHIKDFKFPEMYEAGYDNIAGTASSTAFNHTYLDDGVYKLKIMGLMLNGLRLPNEKIYDKNGKLLVSGFMIVRCPRNKRIQHQGIILNSVYEENCKKDKDADDEPEITRPLPHLNNKFSDGFFTQNSNQYDLYGRCAKRDKICKVSFLPVGNRPHQFTYECPDLFVTAETLKFNPGDYIKLVGTCHKGYLNEFIDYGHDHHYAKSYKTNNAENRYTMGKESRIDDVWNFYSREQRTPYDKDQPELKYTNDIWGIYLRPLIEISGIFEAYPVKDCGGGGTPGVDCFPTTGVALIYYLDVSTGKVYTWNGSSYNEVDLTGEDGIPEYKPALYASGHANTTVLKCKDFMHLDIIESDTSRSSYHIVNFMKPNKAYYTDESQASLEIREYISTGHYQKLDESILFKARKVKYDGTIVEGNINIPKNQIEYYQFDEVEIWGGDCFLQFVDFTRLMPYYYGACEKCGGQLLDYAASHIVPLESNYNLMMRYGRTFAKVGTQPQAVSCNDVDKHLAGGIMDRQPEDWNVNSALQHQNNLQIYRSLPFDIKIVTERRTTWLWSKKKTYSELSDSYRKVLRLNYYDLPGEHGEITASAEFFNTIYCWQESAYGGLRINERATIPTELEEEAVLGKGTDMDGINYISTIFGCQHRSSVFRMNNALYWADGRNGKICRFAQDGNSLLSDSRGAHDIFTRSLPLFENISNPASAKIHGCPDYENNDVIITLNNGNAEESVKFTVAYNEALDKIHYFASFIPTIYLNFRRFILSPDPAKSHNVYVHFMGKVGAFYDNFYKSKLIFVINETPNITKVFDNMLINMPKNAKKRIGEIKLTTQNQVHVLNLKTDTRAEYREDKYRFPMRNDSYDPDRVRGHYCIVEITIDNDDQENDGENIKTVITSIDTIFRYSHKL